jgi:signal transduction histidine kinase
MLILFSIIGFLFSEYLIRSSLKNLQIITDFAKNLDFDNLTQNLHIVGREDDEIKIVATALNKAITKINYKAQKLKDFSSDVAHEFKTSLMIVNSAIDYSTESKRYKDSFLNIKVQVKFLDYLISALLSLSRLESKNIKTKNENI